MAFEYTLSYAQELDKQDPLGKFREEFHFPKVKDQNVIYFTGNSLGLQPKRTSQYVEEIMKDWRELAVEGHFYADKPWWDYHERLAKPLMGVIGAKEHEITVMNTLTVNLHLLMVSFYRPTIDRYKILVEEKAFPSDQYMVNSQLRFHGIDPAEAIVELKKRDGEHFWRTSDILRKIEEVGDELALVLIGGVNYYNGQVFEMEKITRAGREVGAM